MKLTTILVPLDGSALAEMALPKATELAEASGATLLLLRAAEAHALPGTDPAEAQVRVVHEAETYLAEVGERLGASGAGKVTTAVWYGPPAAAIIDAAHLRDIDLIVMTTHGRTGISRLLFGSVAESVLRGTRVPILLIRPPDAAVESPAGSAQARPEGDWHPALARR
jgi:nucleotide-binding universal stress UspA family protein